MYCIYGILKDPGPVLHSPQMFVWEYEDILVSTGLIVCFRDWCWRRGSADRFLSSAVTMTLLLHKPFISNKQWVQFISRLTNLFLCIVFFTGFIFLFLLCIFLPLFLGWILYNNNTPIGGEYAISYLMAFLGCHPIGLHKRGERKWKWQMKDRFPCQIIFGDSPIVLIILLFLFAGKTCKDGEWGYSKYSRVGHLN